MEKIIITCTKNGKTKPAEVLTQNDKYCKIVIEGTQITIEMYRDKLNTPYIGHTAGLEFEWQPKI
tara:strand:+ start:6651 stop:6845 length:195 start_codon:yes stop_codon:yes gene_type:complete